MPFFGNLEGATVVAEDGTDLGTITRNTIDSKSMTNPTGRYGSKISGTSIFNQVGRYGSYFSPQSAFNVIASKPPKVFHGEEFVGYLTINPRKAPRIDPQQLFGSRG